MSDLKSSHIAGIKAYFTDFGPRAGENRWRDDLTVEQMQELWVIMLNDERVSKIKSRASDIILLKYPIWKQNNLQARYVELLEKGELRTPEENEEKEAIRSVWSWVKLVRAESDRLESNNLTVDDANWPE